MLRDLLGDGMLVKIQIILLVSGALRSSQPTIRCLQERARSEAEKGLENSPNIYAIRSLAKVLAIASSVR